jgi:hypothetical protein
MREQLVILGLFTYASDARRALYLLHDQEFFSDEITAAFRVAGSSRRDPAAGKPQWSDQLRQIHRGDEPDSGSSAQFETMLERIRLHHKDAIALDADLSRGAGIIAVRGTRIHEAEGLLRAAGARIILGHERERLDWGHHDQSNHAPHSTPYTPPPPLEPGHILLFREVLRVDKENVGSADTSGR